VASNDGMRLENLPERPTMLLLLLLWASAG
jgi:hypothetical protein